MIRDEDLGCSFLIRSLKPWRLEVSLLQGFECKMINGEPEDELRRLVIAFYPADGEMAAFEV